MGLPREVVEISSDDEEGCSGKLSVSPGPLGWVAKLGDSPAPVPRKKKGKSAGIRGVKYEDGEDDDCVVLDGDPHRPTVVAGSKGRSAGAGASDEVEIVAVKGEEMDGRPMTVTKATATSGARVEERPSPRRSVSSSFKLYVGNLPRKMDNSSLKQLFSAYGEVINAKVVHQHGREPWRSWVFGFVTMATGEASEHAIWYFNKQTWMGRKLRVRAAKQNGHGI
ncbi:hypothetical protein ACQ4PT_063463 [Festuca glaucescens]